MDHDRRDGERLIIAVVDVAAEKGGALTVLNDFYNYVKNNMKTGVYWVFFVSVVDLDDCKNIMVVKCPEIKRGWMARLRWEHKVFPRLIDKYRINRVLSLQNKALPVAGVRQYVYFHNAIHFFPLFDFSIIDRTDRRNFVYRLIVTPLTMRSLQKADKVFVQTDSVREMLYNKSKVLAEDIIVIRLGVNINCNGQGESRDIKGYIYPCGPVTYKKHEIIVDAVRKAGDLFDGEVLFTIEGNENGYAKKIRKKSRNLLNVRFVGRLERERLLSMYTEYGLIFASEIETVGIPFLEAMSYGSPVIARNVGYAREVLGEYDNVYYYNDANELAELIKKYKSMQRGERIQSNSESEWGKIMEMVADDEL